MKTKKIVTILSIFILSLWVTEAYASSKEIKQRMIARLPAIKSLKSSGIVGENNKGFLEFIGNKRENEEVVSAENKDRQAVYEAIAKQQGTTVEVVGKHRAIQIANKAQAGEWLQDGNGKWYQK
jgi:uncharacterized protein YdbL (DUF1318 family)